MISGVGLDRAKIMGLSAMERTMSGVTMPGPDTPMNRSHPTMASASVPLHMLRLVTAAMASLALFSPSRPA